MKERKIGTFVKKTKLIFSYPSGIIGALTATLSAALAYSICKHITSKYKFLVHSNLLVSIHSTVQNTLLLGSPCNMNAVLLTSQGTV